MGMLELIVATIDLKSIGDDIILKKYLQRYIFDVSIKMALDLEQRYLSA